MTAFIIIAVLLLLNLVGLTLHIIYCKKIDRAITWFDVLWLCIAGVCYIPMGIINLKNLKK